MEDVLFGDAHSRQHGRSTLNQTGINIYVDPTVTYPFVKTRMPSNSVQDISRQKKCVVFFAEGRKKATSVYCGLCIILSHRETDIHLLRHDYCMGGKYQCFQRHVANCFVNQIKNGNTLAQRILEKQPRVTTVVGPQTISFQKIKSKRRAKTAAQEQIHRLSPPVDEMVTKNTKNRKT